jgi:chemotaxis methyl-accepting protein methylase
MPEVLKRFLSTLRTGEADELWSYLDSNKESIQEMIEVIASNHPELYSGYNHPQ